EAVTTLPLTWLGLNAVEIENLRSFSNVVVGASDGRPDQLLALPAKNVDPSSIQVEVVEANLGYLPWRRVDDLAAFGRDDRVYVLDAEAGTLRFGDGIRGQLPSAGSRIRVLNMRAGGGEEGNVPAGTLSE